MDSLLPIRLAIAQRKAKELDSLPAIASPKIKLRGIQSDTPDLIQVTPVDSPKIQKKNFFSDEKLTEVESKEEQSMKIFDNVISSIILDDEEKEKSEDLELVTPALRSKIVDLSESEEQDNDPNSTPDLTQKIRSRHASHSSRNEAVSTLPHTHGHSHIHSHTHTNGHANGVNGHAGLALNAGSLHRDALHHQGSTRSRHEKVASVLARLSERSHSVPGSRNSTLTNDHISVIPDGHVNPDLSFSHVAPDPHNPSRRSKKHRNPFTGHLEHRAPSLPIHINNSEIHHEPDLIMTTLPRVPGGHSRHSTLSRQHSMGHRGHGSNLSLAHDTDRDYYIQSNRERYNDDKRKQRFNLQTVMLIGCYTMLFVVAIIVGVVLCQQNGWLGMGNHHSDGSKSGGQMSDVMNKRPRNNIGVAGVGNFPRQPSQGVGNIPIGIPIQPPQRPLGNGGGQQLRPGGNNRFVDSGSSNFDSSNLGKSFEGPVDPLRAFDQNIDNFDFDSNNNQGFGSNNLGINNPTRGNNQGRINNFGNDFNNQGNANNRGGLPSFGQGSNREGGFTNRNNQGTSSNGNFGDSGTNFNDNSGSAGNQGNRNNGGFNQGSSSIGGGSDPSRTSINNDNVGLTNSGSSFGSTGSLDNLGVSNIQEDFNNDGFPNRQDSRGNQGQLDNFGIRNNQDSSTIRNNQGNQNRNNPNMPDNQNRNRQGTQNVNNQGNQNMNIQGTQNLNNRGIQNNNNPNNQNRNNQGSQILNNQGNQNNNNQGNQNMNNQGNQNNNNPNNQNRNNQGRFGNTGQNSNQGSSNNNQGGFAVTGSRNNNSPTENQSNVGSVGFNGNNGQGNGNLNIDAGFVKSQGLSNAQTPFDITGRRSNQGTSTIDNIKTSGMRSNGNSGSQNGQNVPRLSNTGNVQQTSGNILSQGSSGQTSLNQNSQLRNFESNTFNQNVNRNSGSNFQNVQGGNSQPSSRTPPRNNVGTSPTQVSSTSNANMQNSNGNQPSSQNFNTNNGAPATSLANGVATVNKQNIGQILQTLQNINQPRRITDSDLVALIKSNLPSSLPSPGLKGENWNSQKGSQPQNVGGTRPGPIHSPGNKGENWNSQKGSQLQNSGGARQASGRALKTSNANINTGPTTNVQSPSSKPQDHSIMNEFLTRHNTFGGGISVQLGNLMSQSTLNLGDGDVIPAILRPTPDIIVHINPDGIGAGVTLETTRSLSSRTTPRPVNRPGNTINFNNRKQSDRPPGLQSPPRTVPRQPPHSIGIPLPTVTQRTPAQKQIPRVSQTASRPIGHTNTQLSVKSNLGIPLPTVTQRTPSQQQIPRVSQTASRPIGHTNTQLSVKSPAASVTRGTSQNTATGVNRQISRIQPTQNRKIVRAWTHTDTEGTYSQGQVRSDGSFLFTNCKPAGSCIT